jgi:hypothetical protein
MIMFLYMQDHIFIFEARKRLRYPKTNYAHNYYAHFLSPIMKFNLYIVPCDLIMRKTIMPRTDGHDDFYISIFKND